MHPERDRAQYRFVNNDGKFFRIASYLISTSSSILREKKYEITQKHRALRRASKTSKQKTMLLPLGKQSPLSRTSP
jgi:hypothetical protein